MSLPLHIRSYPNADWEKRVSSDYGEEPIWSPKGNELFYRNGDKWMVVAVELDPIFSVSTPQQLFEGRYLNVPGTSYDVSPDGQRFIVLKPELDDSGIRKIHVVLNWVEEIKHPVSSD